MLRSPSGTNQASTLVLHRQAHNEGGIPVQLHDTFNFGVRLYQKGVKRQEEKERFCKQVKEVEEMLKDRELIFRPQLVSKQLREKSAEGRPRKEEELIMYGRMINEKKEMARVINS